MNCTTETIVVLSQDSNILCGYFASRPDELIEKLENELKNDNRLLQPLKEPTVGKKVILHWTGRLVRGIIAESFDCRVRVFLVDYGVSEIVNFSMVYEPYCTFEHVPECGVQLHVDDLPANQVLVDQTVVLSSIQRCSYSGHAVFKAIYDPFTETNGIKLSNGIETSDEKVDNDATWPKTSEEDTHIRVKSPISEEVNKDCKEVVAKPQETNDSTKQADGTAAENGHTEAKAASCQVGKTLRNSHLIELIGRPCFPLVFQVEVIVSRDTFLCSCPNSITAVYDALRLTKLPKELSFDEIRPNQLVLIIRKGIFYRGIVIKLFNDGEISYRVMLVDKPGVIDTQLVLECPVEIAKAAPRALFRVKLNNQPKDPVQLNQVVTILCEKVENNTAFGDLIALDVADHSSTLCI